MSKRKPKRKIESESGLVTTTFMTPPDVRQWLETRSREQQRTITVLILNAINAARKAEQVEAA